MKRLSVQRGAHDYEQSAMDDVCHTKIQKSRKSHKNPKEHISVAQKMSESLEKGSNWRAGHLNIQPRI